MAFVRPSAKKIAEISARVFGNVVKVPPPGQRTPTQYVKAKWQGDMMMEYWRGASILDKELLLQLRTLGVYYDEDITWREKQLAQHKMRGKIKTKKGEGKRQKKGKK